MRKRYITWQDDSGQLKCEDRCECDAARLEKQGGGDRGDFVTYEGEFDKRK